MLRGDHGFYFVVILSRENLDRLPTIEAELLDLVMNSPNWGIQLDGAGHGFRCRHVDGSDVKPDEIVVLAVLPQESTVAGMVELPRQDRLTFFQLPIWCRFSTRSRTYPSSIDFGLTSRLIEVPSGSAFLASQTYSRRSAIPTAF